MSKQASQAVAITALEADDRIDEIQQLYAGALQGESGYQNLESAQQEAVDSVLEMLAKMRFESAQGFETVAKALLAPVAPDLESYIGIAVQNARKKLPDTPGVLVIYTGGTIGSAPKDLADPDSPQVVKPWRELKMAAPKLSALGYPVDAISFEEPLDSCNVGPDHWGTMANIIQTHYQSYAGFVILHGTDTMAYTASALSFVLQELARPVVITGSQIAGNVKPRNDAHQNMITAIQLANPQANGLPLIPEVFVAFGNQIVRGARSKKINVDKYQGFDSPNFPLLGECGDFIQINQKLLRAPSELPLAVFDNMDIRVAVIDMFPGIQDSGVVKGVLADKELQGVIIKAYGAGNIPTQPEFLQLFSDFISRGGIAVVVTGVTEGQVVMGLYETSQVLVDRGLIGGFDITPEAALCKLMVLLGSYPDDKATVKQLMQQSLVGEQKLNLLTSAYTGKGTVKSGASASLSAAELDSVNDVAQIDKVMLRFMAAELDTGGEQYAVIRLALDSGEVLGEFRRENVPAGVLGDSDVPESLMIDLSAHREHFVGKKAAGGKMGSKQRVGFQIALKGDKGATFCWGDAELNIYALD